MSSVSPSRELSNLRVMLEILNVKLVSEVRVVLGHLKLVLKVVR